MTSSTGNRGQLGLDLFGEHQQQQQQQQPAGHLHLYDGMPPHVRGSDTSTGAAASVAATVPRLRGRVLAYVAGRPDGATSDEVELALGLRHQTASARLRELVLLGCLYDSPLRRRTSSGRPATVRMLTALGRRAWRERLDAEVSQAPAPHTQGVLL